MPTKKPDKERSAGRKRAPLLVELDGEGVGPENVDAGAALAMAAAYVKLVTRIAEDEGVELRFTSLEVQDKCVAFAMKPSHAQAAKRAAKLGARYVVGVAEPPTGYRTLVEDTRTAIRALPAGTSAKVLSGKWAQDLRPGARVENHSAWETISLRATPMTVGGRARVTVRFVSPSEARSFVLTLTQEQARELGKHLYRELDIVATVARDEDGNIEDGSILELHAVAEDDPTQAWREWYRDHAAAWDEVQDIEGALGRSRH